MESSRTYIASKRDGPDGKSSGNGPASVGERAARDGRVPEALGRTRSILLFTADQGVLELAAAAAPPTWEVQSCTDPQAARDLLTRPSVRLVIVDDEAMADSTRAWLLDRIRRYAPHALVIYVAASHDPESERRARASRVQYYTAKPLDTPRTLRVLKSFVNASV
jgi:DNA-binding NtrC family response regulator